MLDSSLSLDRRAATCGGSIPCEAQAQRTGLGSLLRALFPISGRNRPRSQPDPLSDHLLQDIGLSRADLQALSL